MLTAMVENDVIDGDVDGVFRGRRLDLVGAALQVFRTLEILMHLDIGGCCALFFCLVLLIRLEHRVLNDFLADLDRHIASLATATQRER